MRLEALDLQRWMNVAIEYFRIQGSLDEIWSKYVTPA